MQIVHNVPHCEFTCENSLFKPKLNDQQQYTAAWLLAKCLSH